MPHAFITQRDQYKIASQGCAFQKVKYVGPTTRRPTLELWFTVALSAVGIGRESIAVFGCTGVFSRVNAARSQAHV